jgi:hypothetical protein
MLTQDLLKLIRQRSFVPFVLVTKDGRHYEIPSPEFLTPLQHDVIIGIPASPVDAMPESTVCLPVEQVQRVETLGPAGKVGA